MKGDEGVEAGEEGADGALLKQRRIAENHSRNVVVVDMYNRFALRLHCELLMR